MNRKKLIYFNQFYIYKINEIFKLYKLVYNLIIENKMGIGDWGLGIGDWGWGLGPIPNPQSPIPNPQSPIPNIDDSNVFIFYNLY